MGFYVQLILEDLRFPAFFLCPVLARNGNPGPGSMTSAWERLADISIFIVRSTTHSGLSLGEPLTSGGDPERKYRPIYGYMPGWA